MTPKSLLLSNEIPNKLTIVGNINQKILQKIFFKMQFDLEKIKKLPADVKNIPDGYEVQIIDHDVEQPKLKQLEFPFPELRANV